MPGKREIAAEQRPQLGKRAVEVGEFLLQRGALLVCGKSRLVRGEAVEPHRRDGRDEPPDEESAQVRQSGHETVDPREDGRSQVERAARRCDLGLIDGAGETERPSDQLGISMIEATSRGGLNEVNSTPGTKEGSMQ